MCLSRASGWRFALASLLLACAGGGARAQVFVADDGQGGVVLSNHPTGTDSRLLIAAPEAPPVAAMAPVPATLPAPAAPAPPRTAAVVAPPALAALIERTAQQHDLPAALLTAVVAVESGFDARAVSPKGALGLMQLMPDTARRYGVRDAFVVADNLGAGARHLRELIRVFDNDLVLALAAYNAGEQAVYRAGRRVPQFAETRRYVDRVLDRAGLARAADARPD